MSRPTVLIVEDEALVLEVAALEFEDAGFDVLKAATSTAALAMLEGGSPVDLLFTDIQIHGDLDGWTLADRARLLRPDLPVIYVTGYSTQAPKAVEGSLLFVKPYRMSEIIEAAGRLV
jgi:CheY-like chemotaxis protein